MFARKTWIGVLILAVWLAGGACAGQVGRQPSPSAVGQGAAEMVPKQTMAVTPPPTTEAPITPVPQPDATQAFIDGPWIIGASALGRPLEIYRLGDGPIRRAIIGGIHGGYEWNTTVLVNEFLRHLEAHPQLLPTQLTLYIMPVLNPDGAAAGTDRAYGRMNGNGVDLNRNWDYAWQPQATHGTRLVDAGAAPFSEPETAALRDFILSEQIQAVVFYHSAFASVFAGAGKDNARSVELARLLAESIGLVYAAGGVPGQITTGNSIDYLTSIGVDAAEVDMRTHEDIFWEENLRGLLAFLNWRLETP